MSDLYLAIAAGLTGLIIGAVITAWGGRERFARIQHHNEQLRRRIIEMIDEKVRKKK